MEKQDAIQLYQDIANFQAECPVILKQTQGFGYTYADLPAILEVIKPLFTKHGLGFIQPLQGTTIITRVFSVKNGASVESTTDIPQNVVLKGQNPFQVAGSAITYYRRYALASLLGIVTDKDTDGTGAGGNGERSYNYTVERTIPDEL